MESRTRTNCHNITDGLTKRCTSKPVYRAEIEWFGIPTVVTVVPLGINPLIGAVLLDGCELNVRYVENGEVRLSPL